MLVTLRDRVRFAQQLTFWAIIAAAFVLRLKGLGFGLPALHDPDELMFELGAVRMLRQHTLNPGWFGHPATTTMYALAITNAAVFLWGHLVGWFVDAKAFGTAIYNDPSWVILPGRSVMLAFGVICVALTYRLAQRLFDRPTALAAAALLAVDPVHITYSQIIRSDMQASLFMLLCLLSALNIVRSGCRRDYLIASLWLGLAIATKWPFAVSGAAVGGAALLRIRREPGERRVQARNFALFLFLSVAVLCAVSPYLVIDYPTVVRNLRGESQPHHLGATGGPPWSNAWWYLRGPLLDALGLLGLLLAAVGTVVSTANRALFATVVAVAVCFFLLIIAQTLVWDRWILPLLPLLSILAAAGLVWLVRRTRAIWGTVPARALVIVAAALLLVPLTVQAWTNAIERGNDTRTLASAWARQHIPAGSTVLIEHYAFDLMQAPYTFLFPLGTAGCVDAVKLVRGKVAYAMIDQVRGGRSNLDYGTIDPAKAASCKADFAILTQYDRYAAERNLFPTEYQAYRRLIESGTEVARFDPAPGRIGGRTVRIIRFE